MNKTKWIPLSMLGLGLIILLIVFIAANFNIDVLTPSSRPIEKNYSCVVDENTKLTVNLTTTDVMIVQSNDDNINIKYYENEYYQYDINETDNIVTIKNKDISRKWYHFFHINFYPNSNKVIISLPTNYINDLSVVLTTGDFDIRNLTNVKDLNVTVTTGEIDLHNCTFSNVNLASTTGEVEIENVVATNIEINTTTAETNLSNINALKIGVNGKTGNVDFENIEADELIIKITTGNIDGELKDSSVNYQIAYKTVTGRSNLPSSSGNGSKTLDLETTTGNIFVEFNAK